MQGREEEAKSTESHGLEEAKVVFGQFIESDPKLKGEDDGGREDEVSSVETNLET